MGSSCCCCIPLRVAVLLLSVLTLLCGVFGAFVTSAAIFEGTVPFAFNSQTFFWWFYALVSLLLIVASLSGLIGAIAKRSDMIFAYYYGFEGIVLTHLGVLIVYGVLIMFNLKSYCNAINNSDWSHSIQSFGQPKETYEDFTISQCRNIAIISFILEAVAIILGLYFATKIYAFGQKMLDRNIQTTRAINVVRVERDLGMQAKV